MNKLLPLAFLLVPLSAHSESFMGLTIEPENRCTPYSRQDGYSSYNANALRDQLIEQQGLYSPYSGKFFPLEEWTGKSYQRYTPDLEHIVGASEAHESGLCSSPIETREAFSSDLLNLTLAEARTNRDFKVAKDAADWLPEVNQCWYVNRVIQVKLKYSLSIDLREKQALQAVLQSC